MLDKSLSNIFFVPFILAVLTTFGLLAALLGHDGIWRWLSWIALIVPMIVMGWFVLPRGNKGKNA
jgi:hypothetical protein